jgi:hypothetical protein
MVKDFQKQLILLEIIASFLFLPCTKISVLLQMALSGDNTAQPVDIVSN